ncbi:transposase family protein [Nostoc sp.]|uniref:transposase family protein n=1 Tax=Nostoc sp. TaxID=1180 RepID=UPI003FA555D4
MSQANDAFNYWVEILRDILPLRVRQSLQRGEPPQRAGSPASQIEEVEGNSEKYQELRRILGEYELIVDSAEQAIARPVDYEKQKQYYSGKKKMHTLSWQFIVLPNGKDIVARYS